MQEILTSGQCGQSFAPDGRPLAPDGLFLMDGIEGLRSLPRHSVDMLLTDPPYGTTRNYWDVPLPLPELWEAGAVGGEAGRGGAAVRPMPL